MDRTFVRAAAAAVALLAGTPASAQLLANESFTNSTVSGWTLADTACLTSPGGPQSCSGGINYNDPAGAGWLRLTTTATDQRGSVITNGSIPFGTGINITFDYAMYAGTPFNIPAPVGAPYQGDGIALFITDASVPGNGTFPTPPVHYGGSLGYCGMTGAVFGIGLDYFGNFSANIYSDCPPASPPTFLQPDHVVIRSGSTDTPPYKLLASRPSGGLMRTDPGWAANAPRVGKRVGFQVLNDASCGANPWRVQLQNLTDGVTWVDACLSALAGPAFVAPAQVRIGFAAATGVATQYQEIRLFQALAAGPTIRLEKTASPTQPAPGGTLTYTVTATNTGSVDAGGTVIADPIPAGITSFAWTCAASGGAACPNASGTGAISETAATFPPGGALVYTVTATLSATPPAAIVNTATATPPGGQCDPGDTPPPCTATTTNNPVPVVDIVKSVDVVVITANGPHVYTVTASNVSSIAANGSVVADPLPAGVASFNWTCAAAGGAVCPNAAGSGAISETIATFPGGGSITYTINAVFTAAPPAQVTNTATLTPPPGALCAPANTPSPCTATTVLPSAAELSITKVANVAQAATGGTIVYTVVVTNVSSIAANNTVIADAVPAGIGAFTWTCAASGGAACPNASGSGAINEVIATFPSGAAVTYVIAATVTAVAPASILNTATATPPGGGVCAPGATAPPCTASTTTPVPPPVVGITKSASPAQVQPNGTISYQVIVTNTGTVAANGTVVSDPIPAGIAAFAWTCDASGGAACPAANGTGAINQVIATFPVGGVVRYFINATAVAAPGTITNVATATPPPGGVCSPGSTAPPCTATTVTPPAPLPPPNISIGKTGTPAQVTPNGVINYVVVVANTGVVPAGGTVVTDPIPVGIATFAWTCTASGGAACPNASGTGAINQTIAVLPVGGSVRYAITATATSTPGTITNVASAQPPPGGVCSTPTLIGSAPAPCTATVVTPPAPPGPALISVSKTANTNAVTPGGTIVYTIVVSNTSVNPATGTVVSDPIPAGIASFAWTCAAGGGAVCPAASGAGAINQTIATFPGGATVTYTVTAVFSATPPQQVTNVASASPPGGGCAPGATPPPCVSPPVVTGDPPGIPTMSEWSLLVLASLLFASAWRRRRALAR